ncbi:MAG: DNA methyltransferase [Nitrososphaerota archaeon]
MSLEKSKIGYRSMELVTYEDYLEFIRKHRKVIIEDVEIELGKEREIESYSPPSDYKLETTTVWSFPDRGEWATHRGDYRGNWSPFIPRNLILRFTKPGEWVLDQMMGSGTTLVECKLLGRNAIGVDINRNSVMVARDRLDFSYNPLDKRYVEPEILTYVGDARNLDKVRDESIDLIATHPLYASIVSYTKARVEGDLSTLNLEDYIGEMKVVAEECFRVLKPGKYCAILIGDTRKHGHYVPIAFKVMQKFLEVGFVLKEDIIKQQWRTKITREKWRGWGKQGFYLIAHEHLFIFRKPMDGEKLLKYSSRWW